MTLLAQVSELRPTPAKSLEKAVSHRVLQFLDGNLRTFSIRAPVPSLPQPEQTLLGLMSSAFRQMCVHQSAKWKVSVRIHISVPSSQR
jgi:hypothetical protein